MKILHLTKKYLPIVGGDAFVVYNLKKQQVKLGHEVHVVTSNCDEINGGDVLKFGLKERPFNLDRITPRRIVSLLLLSFWGLKNIRKLSPDIIHSHSADLGFFISIAARIHEVPVINTCHGISFNDEQYSFLKRFAEKFFLKYANFNKIITVDMKGLHALNATKIKNAVYVPNGIDLCRFQNRKERDNTKTRFLFVGRLERQKGVIYLIKAADLLKNKNDLEIIIVGEGSEADYLMKTTRELGLGEIVQFKGKVGEQKLTEYYLGCDAFILPSLWEGMPLTLLEAAAAEMPIIASDVGGISSLFTHEESALIIKPEDAKALASAMLKLMKGKELREKLGMNARRIVEKFSWDTMAKELNDIYRELIKI
ncbi:MAG: glycosyltransferase family 4 protein [Candidatus Methanoperedens sp.]|nr:glycosyltransferase family 4 protein [Candidatus Methanoperedens sp.]MCZ7405739.1 glycosyltransferase family 4 protein [Candidatus Methanoperedens sp.]